MLTAERRSRKRFLPVISVAGFGGVKRRGRDLNPRRKKPPEKRFSETRRRASVRPREKSRRGAPSLPTPAESGHAAQDSPSLKGEAGMGERRYGGITLGGIIVIVGIVVALFWSLVLGLIIALIGLIAFGGFVRGKWY